MEFHAIAGAVATLREACTESGPELATSLLAELDELALTLVQQCAAAVQSREDPRLLLAHAKRTEELYRHAIREQLRCAAAAELGAAHALPPETYDEIATGTCDYEGTAELTGGRSCYQDTSDLLAGWLKIDYFEARTRVADAHLLVARPTMAGTGTTARYSQLAESFDATDIDPRAVRQVARKLAKAEGPDLISEGTPSEPWLRCPDGRTVEERATDLLRGEDPRTAAKQISELLRQQAPAQQSDPELGLFARPTRGAVHVFTLHTNAAGAELIRSAMAQADNPRTQAGAEARRQRTDLATGQEPEAADGDTPSWLSTDQPAPEWAGVNEPSPNLGTPPAIEPEPAPESGVTVAERRLNAVLDKLGAVLPGAREANDPTELAPVPESAALSEPSATPRRIAPEVIVHINLEDLTNLADGRGITAHGLTVGPADLRQMLCEAEVVPMVLNGRGQVLDVGRAQRLFPPPIKKAIIARDRGCIVPGCTAPVEHLEAHHYKKSWKDGGHTKVSNGCALCSAHHHAVHAGQLQVIEHAGLPHVLLPAHQDPLQIPRRNNYWRQVA